MLRLKSVLLALVLLAPAVIWAWPQPGDPAPNATIPDTAWVTHTLPEEYHGKVVQLFFWHST